MLGGIHTKGLFDGQSSRLCVKCEWGRLY